MIINQFKMPFGQRVLSGIQNIRRSLAAREIDYIFIQPYSMGDIYHDMLLMKEFKKNYLKNNERIYYGCRARALPIIKLFNSVDVSFEISGNIELLIESINIKYGLVPGVPFASCLDMHYDGILFDLLMANKINLMDAKKILLKLPFNCNFDKPIIPENDKIEFDKYIEKNKIRKEDILIINHGSSIEGLPSNCFLELIKNNQDKNIFYDATISTTHPPGTIPLVIPYLTLFQLANYLSTIVVIRSGIVDLISTCSASINSIYPPAKYFKNNFPEHERIQMADMLKNMTLAKFGIECKENAIFIQDEMNEELISNLINQKVI